MFEPLRSSFPSVRNNLTYILFKARGYRSFLVLKAESMLLENIEITIFYENIFKKYRYGY